jgi:hypothetical protein
MTYRGCCELKSLYVCSSARGLEPPLRLAAAMLGSFDLKRKRGCQWLQLQAHPHAYVAREMPELSFLTKLSGGSLGYGSDHVSDSKRAT